MALFLIRDLVTNTFLITHCMKIFILILVLLFSSISVFASGLFSLSKSQQNRLNMIIKQLKVPSGDYKLTVTSTGVILREYEPTIITST